MSITRISLSHFRGATRPLEIRFDEGRKLALILGENGSGKSTIVDGIDLVSNRNPGSISEISSTKVSEHLHSLGSSQSQLRVEMDYGGVTHSGTVSGMRVRLSDTSPRPQVRVLRRSKLLSLVTATPSDRFNELKRLIDIENVLKNEDKLGISIRDVRKELDGLVSKQTDAIEALQQAFEEERNDSEAHLSPEEWAKARVASSTEDLEQDAKSLRDLLNLWEGVDLLLEKKNERQVELDAARKKLEEERKALAELIESLPTLVSEIIPVLRDAVTYFDAETDATNCPVCRQGIVANDVRADLRTRLTSLELVESRQKAAKQAEENVKHLESVTGQAYTDLVDHLHQMLVAIEKGSERIAEAVPINPNDFPDLRSWEGGLTKENIEQATGMLRALLPAKAEMTELNERWQKAANQASSIRRNLETLMTARVAGERSQAILDQLIAMMEVVRKTRIEYTNKVLDAIADDCDALYQRIHPGEGIGGVRFHLDEERRGSLHQTGTFAGLAGKVPQAYFSESHLDTLGFCFFLALARYTTAGKCIIVLDDIFSSVDLRHIQRILELLLDELASFEHIILTTHQRRWTESVRSHEVGRQTVQIKELFPWRIEAGIILDDIPTHVEELRTAVASPTCSREDLAAKSGRAIEMVLGTLTRFLRCSVQRNPDDRYTAVDLLNAMKRPAKSLAFRLNGGDDIASAETLPRLLGALTGSVITVRNALGGHFNWNACDIDHATTRQFAQHTLELIDVFLCDRCSSLPMREKDAYLRCRCGKREVLKDWRS